MASLRLILLVALASMVGFSVCQNDTSQESEVNAAPSMQPARLLSSTTGLSCFGIFLRTFNGVFRRLTFSGVVEVHSLVLQREYSFNICVMDDQYGAYGTDVWVRGSCSGLFEVCLTRGNNRVVPCYSFNYKSKRCNIGHYIKGVYIKVHKSAVPCVEGFSYKIEGQDLVVFNGCRADFIVTYR